MTTAQTTPEGSTRRAELSTRLDELERQRSADVRWRLEGARTVEAVASAAGLAVEMMRARLVVADMLQRLGDNARGAKLAVEVNAWALAEGPRALQCRSHLVLSSLFENIADLASSLDHAVRALELLDPSTPDRDRGNVLLRLADASALIGSVDEARRRYGEAAALFTEPEDEESRLIILNNLAVLEYESGNAEAALAAAERLAHACGTDSLHPCYADTIARAHLTAGDLEAAERMVRLGHQLWRAQGDAQAVTPAELALTHVEILLGLGRLEEAAGFQLDEALTVCLEQGLRSTPVQLLEVPAALCAARGVHSEAAAAHRRFHEEFVAVRSHQQEAAARTRQALAETAEARAEAQRFWEQARRDPLTELFNRRFVDEELPRFLDDMARGDGCLVAALVDVDHFKRINDRFSHAVGDQVLNRLGSRLVVAAQPGFAARLGGEEFLVLLPSGSSLREAVAELDQLRAAVQSEDWADVDPALSVTISIGVAVAAATDTQASLLTRADDHLYRAKQEGRNRIVTDSALGVSRPLPG